MSSNEHTAANIVMSSKIKEYRNYRLTIYELSDYAVQSTELKSFSLSNSVS